MADILPSVGKIERESVTRKVLSVLRRHILSGEIRPGTRLVESRLAGQLGVSRAPLREAFLILEREGLVSTEHGEGTYVSEVSEQTCREIYMLRGVLEGLAARLATENATEEQLDRLSRIVDQMRGAATENDNERVIDLDLEFHESLWEISGVDRLRETLRNMMGPIRMFLAVNTQVYSNLVDNALEHEALVEVISSGDEEKAREIMIEHIEEAGRRNLAYIRAIKEAR